MKKWILTSDRVPEPVGNRRYLVSLAHFDPDKPGRTVIIASYDARGEGMAPYWAGIPEGTRVVAWMPLPVAYYG